MLNASYEPLLVVNWQKAVILWFQGKVDILEHHNQFVRSFTSQFQLPSVIRLKTYVRIRKDGPVRFSRENVYRRDNFQCQYCYKNFTNKDLTLDHVLPVSRGGKKNWENIVTACLKCNQKKGNKTPKEARMPLKQEPKEPKWVSQTTLLASQNAVPPETWRDYLTFSAFAEE